MFLAFHFIFKFGTELVCFIRTGSCKKPFLTKKLQHIKVDYSLEISITER